MPLSLLLGLKNYSFQMSRSSHAKCLNGREKREGYVQILLVKWYQIGISLSEIYDKAVKSRDQDQTAPMFWLILLYTFPLRECMVIKGRLRIETTDINFEDWDAFSEILIEDDFSGILGD